MKLHTSHEHVRKNMWRKTNVILLPSAILAIAGAMISSSYGSVRRGDFDERFISLLGLLLFITFSVVFLRVLTKTIARLIALYYMTEGRAGSIQFLLRLFGYIAIVLFALSLLEVPVGKLLLGGAAVGIILGVAAQQALANLFASIVLIISHPFIVGDEVLINSGALGGEYTGTITDIGLTHTKLVNKKGKLVLLPNATILAGATITKNVSVTKT